MATNFLTAFQWPFQSPADIVPSDDHKAFRAITTLMSKVQQKSDTPPAKEDESKMGGKILSLSVAFSILAALEYQVVAVMAKPMSLTGKLEVIVCPNHPHSTSKDRSSLQVAKDSVVKRVEDTLGAQHLSFSILASRNARKDDKHKNLYPTIMASAPPDGLSQNATQEQLEGYVNSLCTNKKPDDKLYPLHHHLDVLRQLLLLKAGTASPGTPTPSSDTISSVGRLMFRYVAATAYRKMYLRIYFNRDGKMRPQSKSFLAYLTAQWSSLGCSSLLPDRSGYGYPEHSTNQPFLTYLASFPEPFRTKYPKLSQLGRTADRARRDNRAKGGDSTKWYLDLRLYTDETCQEFHDLFTECLKGFVEGLKELYDIRTHPPQSNPQAFEKKLSDVVGYGCCLLPLIRSLAIQSHINTLFLSKRGGAIADNRGKDGDMDDLYGDGGEGVGDDDDDVQPLETELGVWPHVKPYCDWLRLITAEFDAANHLVQFFLGNRGLQETDISIQVLTPSYTSSHSLSWTPLFKDFIHEAAEMSNAKILNYLTTIKSSLGPARSWLEQLQGLRKLCKMVEFKDLIAKESLMEIYSREGPLNRRGATHGGWSKAPENQWAMAWWEAPSQKLNMLPDWPPLLYNILHEINTENSPTGKDSAQSFDILAPSFNHLFSRLWSSLFFFQAIASTDRDDDTSSSSRIHCEVCLASLVMSQNIETDDNYKTLLEKIADFSDFSNVQPIMGVSKRCCQTCTSILNKLLDGQIITRGSHSTVSPCALPPWLPTWLVKMVQQEFSLRLRQELVRLMKNPESWYRNSANSGGSAGRSSDGEVDYGAIV